jgi:nucleoside-diphosphate-sugar epimerase
MGLHVIVGAGPIGSATASQLASDGHQVRVITRSGGGPVHPGVERVAADATNAGRLAELASGATALYNCANPRYHRWPIDWPPLAAALLSAAERTGAGLVTMSNVYGYGPVDVAMTEDLPLAATTVKGGIRAQMWQDALAAHQAGRIRATEARASDFVGLGAKSVFTEAIVGAVSKGRRAYAPVDFDVPHSLTYTVDAGRTLAVLGTDGRAWGRAWHVPTDSAVTLREAARRLAILVGAPAPRLSGVPNALLRVAGLFAPELREIIEMRYQFERSFVLDSTAAQTTFGLTPTTLDDALRATLPQPAPTR